MDYKIDYFDKFSDHRGDLIVFLRESEIPHPHKQFGQIYFVTFDTPKVVRGNHYHKEWREWFGVVHGKLEVVLHDVRNDERQTLILDAKADKYVRLEIGPYIAHAFRNLSRKASLLNYTNSEWYAHDTFPYQLFP